MKITVCIPTYNRPLYTIEAIKSILNQTYKNWEIWVYDDGSTDDTVSLLTSFQESLPDTIGEKIKVFQGTENGGQGFSRRWFKQNVKTEWMAWQDSDDYSDEKRLAFQVRKSQDEKLDICFSYLMWFSGNNPKATRTMRKINVNKYSKNIRSINNNTNTATALFNRKAASLIPDAIINHGGYDTVWHYAMIAHNLKIGCVEQPLYYARRHPGRLVYRKEDPKYADERAQEQVVIWDLLKELKAEGLNPKRPSGIAAKLDPNKKTKREIETNRRKRENP